jgi:hypothetical protein
MFGDAWRPSLHVIDPFAIPFHWPLWRGMDDGYAAPACVLWLSQDPDTRRTYVINELYRSGMTPERVAEEVKRRDSEIVLRTKDGEVLNGRPLQGVIDSGAFVNLGNGVSRGDAMNKLGLRWSPATKGPGSRIGGVQHIHRLLAPRNDSLPGIQFFRNCQNLVDILPSLPRSKRDPEDIDDEAEDHCADALRYSLEYRMGSFSKMTLKGI